MAKGVRPMLGLLGGAHLGDIAAPDLKLLTILPGESIAFGVDADGQLVRIQLSDGGKTETGVRGVDALVTSPRGASIGALAGLTVKIISAAGSVVREVELTGEAKSIAVADDGLTVAAVIADGDQQSLYLNSTKVYTSDRLLTPAFFSDSPKAIFGDGSGSLFVVDSTLKLSSAGSVSGAAAVAALDADRILAIAGKSVTSVRISTGETALVECSCEPSMIKPTGDFKFILTNAEGAPIWLLDAAQEQLRVGFVPEAVNE